jgi:hypothetical protein
MVTPITGPTTKTTTMGSWYYKTAQVTKQAKPIDRPLPYSMRSALVNYTFGTDTSIVAQAIALNSPHLDYDAYHNSVRIVAYDRLKSKISDRASIGAALAEVNKSVEMVTTRLLQMGRVIRSLKKGRPQDAWYEIQQATGDRQVNTKLRKERQRRDSTKSSIETRKTLSPWETRDQKSNKKNWASTYLEMHFGWEPMVQDIYDAVEVLQEPIKDVRIRAAASRFVKSKVYIGGEWDGSSQWDYGRDYRVKYGCDVAVANPNLWLANQLGLLNPLTIAWELVPFSFVADWFFNVEQFLSFGTDFLGLTVKNEFTTDAISATINHRYVYRYIPQGAMGAVAGRVERARGFALPSLGLKPAKLWGWKRAASAAALLTVLMPSSKKK